MSDARTPEGKPPILDTDGDGPAAVTLDPATIDELREFGEVRSIASGDVLYEAGDDVPAFFVVLEGEVEIVRQDGDKEVVARHGPGRFLGELNLLTGQRTYLTARASKSGRVLATDLAVANVLPHHPPHAKEAATLGAAAKWGF